MLPSTSGRMSKKKRKKELHYISVGFDGSCGGEYLCTAGTKQFGTYSGPGRIGSAKQHQNRSGKTLITLSADHIQSETGHKLNKPPKR